MQGGETRAVMERTGRIVTRERYETAHPLVELPDSLGDRLADERAPGPPRCPGPAARTQAFKQAGLFGGP